MKFLFYLENLCSGGVQRRTMRLIGGIQKYAPDDWTFILLVNFSEGEHFSHVPKGVQLHVLGDLHGASLYRALRHKSIELKPDVVVCCMGRQLLQWFLSTCFTAVCSKVIVIQAVPVMLSAYSRIKNTVRSLFMRSLYPRADAVVCVSDAVLATVQQLNAALARKAQRIYNPVFDETMPALADSKVQVFDGYSGVNAVAVGRLNVQKDYGTMIRSVAEVIKVLPQFHLHILGCGELLEPMQVLAAELGVQDRVVFHGYVANPYPYLKQADLFVMSSLWEGLPNAMVEALALGTKVVSTDCIAGPDEILASGEYGQLVKLGDHQAFAQAILTEIKQAREPQMLAQRGRYYSVENSAKAYISLAAELMR